MVGSMNALKEEPSYRKRTYRHSQSHLSVADTSFGAFLCFVLLTRAMFLDDLARECNVNTSCTPLCLKGFDY